MKLKGMIVYMDPEDVKLAVELLLKLRYEGRGYQVEDLKPRIYENEMVELQCVAVPVA